MSEALSRMSRDSCERCGAVVAWCAMVSGRLVMVDPDPTARGFIEVRGGLKSARAYGRIVPILERDGRDLFVYHNAGICDQYAPRRWRPANVAPGVSV